ncbi:MAG: MmcQ/YjbR family DNA-binding protein [Candidatus Limnocylindrales bacterium]
MSQTAPASELWEHLRAYALSLPGSCEDHPWGETVAKVGKKVFVFVGMGGSQPGMGVKLPESQPLALAQPGVKPSGYGLGKASWVSVGITTEMPFEMLRDWIDESYRAVAPKTLVADLEARSQTPRSS